MSVICGKGYCFVDEKKLWDEIYGTSPLRIRNEFYDIWDTFKMDSQALSSQKPSNNRRKRKAKTEGGAEFLTERTKLVEATWKRFVADGTLVNTQKTADNNRIAREAAKSVKNFDWIERYSAFDVTTIDTVDLLNEGIYEGNGAKLVMYKNTKDSCVEVQLDGDRFVVSQNSRYIQGSVNGIKHLDYANEEFDVIVMDPPWSNKSVKRLRTYNTFQSDDLYDLPIESLCHAETLVIIWLTNNPTVHSGVDEILEAWGLRRVCLWHWIKVTQNGDPATTFESNHKVPYESFVIAQLIDAKVKKLELENDYCIISAPNSCHSRKPPVVPILKRLYSNLNCDATLELYARYLLPNTTSIGYEVLKFQHIDSNFREK